MKYILSIVLLSLVLANAQAQTKAKEIPTQIKEVIVFRSGAQILREAKATVPAGRTELVFSNLPATIDPNKLQVGAIGDMTILSVNHRRNYLKNKEEDNAAKTLQTQLMTLQDKLDKEQAMLQVFNEEEGMILANKAIGGQQSGVSIQELKAAAEFYRQRLGEIKLQKLEIAKRIKGLQEDMAKVQGQLNEINAQSQPIAISEVALIVETKTAVENAVFRINYMLNDAGWTPLYDLRVEDVSHPVGLVYKADIRQGTGEDWKDAKLTLSTGNPSQSGVRPWLGPWRLYVAPPPVAYRDRAADAQTEMMAKSSLSYEADDVKAGGPVVDQVENTTTIEFWIASAYDIPSNGQPYTVVLSEEELPATYEYYAVPKLDKDAFLTAKVTDWDQFNLLSGKANLFFEDTYIGQTYLNVDQPLDTLTLSLGRDKGVSITRTKQKQYNNKQFLGNKTTATIGWEIEVRNKKKQAIHILIEDQYPISTSDDIEVKLDASKGAEVTPEEGKLLWKLDLKPGESKKLEFRYSVKYPKKMGLVLE